MPEGLTQVPAKRKLIIFPEGKGSEAVSRETNKDGTFCTTVKPGKHVVRVSCLFYWHISLNTKDCLCYTPRFRGQVSKRGSVRVIVGSYDQVNLCY